MNGRSVVDASVVLAWLQDEPGADAAEPMLMEGVIGAANWSEVLQKSKQANADPEQVARLLTSFGLEVADVTERDGARAAGLWRRGSSLSLADRLCLALAERLELPVATTDAAWPTSGARATITPIR
jgi:PIN domain nuclease of toxin-antitoxin system